jgi:hypothetical protein
MFRLSQCTSVLFEPIASRYERRSLLVTSNQPFGEWTNVFPDAAMTLAAVDRLVNHANILEMNVRSYRRCAATAQQKQRHQARQQGQGVHRRDRGLMTRSATTCLSRCHLPNDITVAKRPVGRLSCPRSRQIGRSWGESRNIAIRRSPVHCADNRQADFHHRAAA